MAILKNTTISDTGFLQLPAGTTAQRPGAAAGQMRYNTTTGQAEFYNAGVAAWVGTPATGVVATGGTVYDVDVEGTTYRVHVFTTTGNSSFTVSQNGPVEYLIVGGGGSGGNDHGGGGGGGGLIQGTTTVTPQVYTITVGAGAASAPAVRNNTTSRGTNGGTSSAFGVTALGGGGGGGSNGSTSSNGRSGGSGGGSSGFGSPRTPGLGTSGQGNNGGTGGNNAPDYQGAGGGGAGAQGANGANPGVNSYGGTGIASSISGNLQFYGGGGGGSSSYQSSNGAYGSGGAGGGGHGATNNLTPIIPLSPAKSGVPNTGGGGGGANRYAAGGSQHLGPSIGPSGAGGSGIVIIRYPLRQENPINDIPKVAGDGLVLDLDFSKPTVYSGLGTSVTDSRLNGITGTLVNGPVFTDARTHRSNFEFNGTSSHIDITPIPRNTSFTLEAWVYSRNVSLQRQYIYTQQANPPTQANFTYMDRQGMMFSENILQCQFLNTDGVAGTITSNQTFSNNTWYHIVVAHNGTTANMYINGNRDIGATLTGTQTTAIPNVNQARIGRRGDVNGDDYFNGYISQVKDYNRALSAQEIQDNYNATRWRFGV